MHFSIPDTEEIVQVSSKYKVYNIHINGVLHCSVRYSQLHDLNERLKKSVGSQNLPTFPPKRFFHLSKDETEDRKILLEKYIQKISQDSDQTTASIFNTFLRQAQQETRKVEKLEVSLDVWLLNGVKNTLTIFNTDKTDLILQNVLSKLGLPEKLFLGFGLFLIRMEGDDWNKFSVIRNLQDFECPYISLRSFKQIDCHKIVIRKVYWDYCSVEKMMLENRIALNLLYIQAVSDVNLGWTDSSFGKERLKKLEKQGSKLEFVELCKTLPGYGCIQFDPCVANYPKKNSQVVVAVGNFQVIFKVLDDVKPTESFSVTRIKSWKISSEYEANQTQCTEHPVLQLSFEFLLSKGNLQWINLLSNQAIMMSMCIKSMVDELIRNKKGEKLTETAENVSNVTFAYKPRDKTTEILFDSSQLQSGEPGSLHKTKDTIKTFTRKINVMSQLKKSSDDSAPLPIHQVAPLHSNIGDDDL